MEKFHSPKVTWPENGVPFSEEFKDAYFGGENAEEESKHVFIEGNQLFERWSQLKQQHKMSTFLIGESGFGTGLNFLKAWQAWNEIAPQNATLHYVSIEKYPLNIIELGKALARRRSLDYFIQQLLHQYPNPLKHTINQLSFANGSVKLTLIFNDILEGLKHLTPYLNSCDSVQHNQCNFSSNKKMVDAWFLDGFAPSKNPAMWTPEVFKLLALNSHNSTTLATFTVAGHVRNGLSNAGFLVQKKPGFGKKLEMTVGSFFSGSQTNVHESNTNETPTPYIDKHPSRQKSRVKSSAKPAWHLTDLHTHSDNRESVSIIGAGLAGAHTANALAIRGYNVTVFDKGVIANGASGNPQGIVYSRFSHEDDALALFNDVALPYADILYNQGYYRQFGSRCGVIQLSQSVKQQELFRAISARYQSNPQFVSDLTRIKLQEKTGLTLNASGLITELGGWLRPAEVCRALLSHPNISVIENSAVSQILGNENGDWRLVDNTGKTLNCAGIVIVANASCAKEFSQTKNLKLKPIRGQMSYAHIEEKDTLELKSCLCTDGYVAPYFRDVLGQRVFSFGATFDLHNASDTVSESDNQKNLAMLEKIIPQSDLPKLLNIKGRVSFRCTTTDYLPVIGPVCDHPNMMASFAAYRKNKYQIIDCSGKFHKNLFINVGHGSRGLSYTPISAEIIACLINGEPLPIEEDLYKQLHPARFVIRDLVRNKI